MLESPILAEKNRVQTSLSAASPDMDAYFARTREAAAAAARAYGLTLRYAAVTPPNPRPSLPPPAPDMRPLGAKAIIGFTQRVLSGATDYQASNDEIEQLVHPAP